MITELLVSKVLNRARTNDFCDAGICYQAYRRGNTVRPASEFVSAIIKFVDLGV